MTSSETERGSLSRGQTCQLVQSRPWRTTSRRLKSISPRIYRCSEPLLLLGRKKKYEAKGLAIQEQENSLRTPLEIQRTFPRLVFIALGLEEPPLRLTKAGIADRLFKRHGRWASENAKDGYVKDDFNSRLSVTKSLGI